jgi:addiction module RelE/StbE family toxin
MAKAPQGAEPQEYSISITESAENDLDEIVSYIAQDNVQIALKILEKLRKKIYSLSNLPFRGRRVPELLDQNIKDYREIIETPWRIIYKVENYDVTILTIIDGRRNVQDILTSKLMK